MRDRLKNGKISPAFFLVIAHLVLMGVYFFLARLADFAYAVPEMVGGTAIITVILAGIAYLGTTGKTTVSPAVILILVVCFRVLFVFHPVQLSRDEAFRGRVGSTFDRVDSATAQRA
jgi:hypothetical protein